LGGAGDTGSISSYGASTPMRSNGFAMPSSSSAAGMGTGGASASYDMPPSLHLGDVKVEDHDDDDDDHGQQPGRTVPTHAPPATTKQLASAYDMGESNEELVKLRNALQKLQAENISLKAKMGTMTDEERDLQKELNATIAEVSTLSNELTKTRAQVLASKSRLLESTAELRAAQEKKGYVEYECRTG
jgi:hypothetical protein